MAQWIQGARERMEKKGTPPSKNVDKRPSIKDYILKNMATGLIGGIVEDEYDTWHKLYSDYFHEPPYKVYCAGCAKCTPLMHMDELKS